MAVPLPYRLKQTSDLNMKQQDSYGTINNIHWERSIKS